MNIRLLSLALAAVLSLGLFVGCNDNGDTQTTTTTEAVTTTTEEATTTTEEETTTANQEETTAASKKSTTKKQVAATTTSKSKVTYRTMNKTTTTAETESTVVDVTEPTTTTTVKITVPSRSKKTTKDWSHIFPVKVADTIEVRAAAVNNNLNGSQKVKLPSDRAFVTNFNEEWAFTHHPGLTYFNGKWYANFTQGYKDEDAPGQRIVVCSSEDFIHWSEPVVVGPCTENLLVPGTETANICGPIYACDGKLFVSYGATSYPPSKFLNGKFQANADLSNTVSKSFIVMSSDGVNWSEPVTYTGGGGKDTLRQTMTGRWLAAYGTGAFFSDKETPDGLFWEVRGLTADQRNDAIARNNGTTHTESSWYQTKDGILHIMVRSDTGFFWMTESYDNGETWTDLYPTSFGTSSTMWKFGELPDGRIYGVGTSGNASSGRDKLELWLSEDGINFDTCYIIRDEKDSQQRKYGWAKGGLYGYPSVQIRDGYLHVLYSRHKEYMEVSRVKLSDIK